MAIIKAVSSHASITTAINYIIREEKTERKLISGSGVNPGTAAEEMMATKAVFGKTGGRTYKHFVQSFAPDEKITAEQAHAIAMEFIERSSIFSGYEILVATHVDRDHTHSHFIVNSVSVENGKKFQMSAHDLQKMKDLSDKICEEHGLSVCAKGKTFDGKERTSLTAWAQTKYRFLTENSKRSYLEKISEAVRFAGKTSQNREEFIENLAKQGIRAEWNEKKKHIVYYDGENHKVRGANIEKTFHIPAEKDALQASFEEHKTIEAAAERLETLREVAVTAAYKTDTYTKAKADIEHQIEVRASIVEIVRAKLENVSSIIRIQQEKMCELKEKLTHFHGKKHKEAEMELEHAELYSSAVQANAALTMQKFGFDTVADVEAAEEDLNQARQSERELNRMAQEEYGKYLQAVSVYRAEVSAGIENRDEIQTRCMELRSEHTELAKNGLKECFGEEFSKQLYERAEQKADEALAEQSSENINIDIDKEQRRTSHIRH